MDCQWLNKCSGSKLISRSAVRSLDTSIACPVKFSWVTTESQIYFCYIIYELFIRFLLPWQYCLLQYLNLTLNTKIPRTWFFYHHLDFLKHHVPTVSSFTVTGNALQFSLCHNYSTFTRKTVSENEFSIGVQPNRWCHFFLVAYTPVA